MRPVSQLERERAFAKHSTSNLEGYKDLVREFEPGVAYALSVNGTTPRAIRVNVSRAARVLGLELRWAPYGPKATEVIVELK